MGIEMYRRVCVYTCVREKFMHCETEAGTEAAQVMENPGNRSPRPLPIWHHLLPVIDGSQDST